MGRYTLQWRFEGVDEHLGEQSAGGGMVEFCEEREPLKCRAVESQRLAAQYDSLVLFTQEQLGLLRESSMHDFSEVLQQRGGT